MKNMIGKMTVLTAALLMAVAFMCAPVSVNGSNSAQAADKPVTHGTLGGILIPPTPRGGPQNPHPPTCPTRTNC